VRSAIPPRVAAVDKELPVAHHETWAPQSKKPTVYQSFKPFLSSHEQLSDIVRDFTKLGSVLIVAPDERDVDKIIETLSLTFTNVLKVSSSSTREERYRNFLLAIRLESSIVVGTRSAIFAPVRNLAGIIIYKESSPDHYDHRRNESAERKRSISSNWIHAINSRC
jgi:primosomal protein N' (replication factor Y)